MNKFIAFVKAAGVAIDTYLEKERQSKCQHRWRPAKTMHGPARYCNTCEKTEQLTTDMYYAQFGTMPHTWY